MASCAKIAKVDSKVIKLDVGGTKYKTSLATLLMYPDPYLGQLFSGKFESPTNNEDGEYFIDANGEMFKYILDFLRRSKLMLPEDFKELDLLCGEADFFQIEPLIQELEVLKNEREVLKNESEALRNQLKESKKKKILNVFGRIVDEQFLFESSLKVSYFQKPGGSFELMNDVNPKPSEDIDIYAFEECLSAQGYTLDVQEKGLSYGEVQAYLYSHGITEIPIISKFDASGRITVQEEYTLNVWSKI